MSNPALMEQKLVQVFEKRQAAVLTEVIREAADDRVPIADFDELKAIVRDLGVTLKELAESQRRTDARFEELALAQKELAEAQKRTDARFEELALAQKELAEAQKRTDARFEELAEAQKRTELRVEELALAQARTEARVEELAEAQKRTELRVEELALAQARTEARVEELALAQKELAEAQKRTEARVEELAEAQKRTELRVEELALAQARTEARVEELALAQKELAEAQRGTQLALDRLSRQVGGLSDRMGGDLEDTAYIVIHDLFEREYGWEVGPLQRDYVRSADGEYVEFDLFGQARDPKRPDVVITVIGEVKFNLTKKEVEDFARNFQRVRSVLPGEVYPVCFCYRIRPEVRQLVRELGFHLVFSYGRLG